MRGNYKRNAETNKWLPAWEWLLQTWSINLGGHPLRSPHLSGRWVNVYHQASFLKGYVPVVNQLLYFGFESVAVFGWMPFWSSMISTLHIWVIPGWVRLWNRLKRLGNHQRVLNQRLQKLAICHDDWMTRRISSFQVSLGPKLILTLISISRALGLLIWMKSKPGLFVMKTKR